METSKLRVFTAFSGYDSQCLALNRLPIDYELVGWSEIDKYAIRGHNALFPESTDRNYGDISQIDWSQVPDFDLFTYSSPCQDFSQAGKQRGGHKGSGTRSSLLWECEKAISIKRPKYLLMENVAALVSSKFIKLFQQWMTTLEGYQYKNYAKILNAKDYGVPQNRERIFLISIRVDDKSQWESLQYHFPKEIPLTKRLADVLENEVDESYYLSDEKVASLLKETEKQRNKGNGFGFSPRGTDALATAITTREGSRKCDNFVKVIANLQPDNNWQGAVIRSQNQVIDTNGLAATIGEKYNAHPYKIAERIVLGWTRDEKSNVVDYHEVDVVNCVTANKRENTQNYVCCGSWSPTPNSSEIKVVGNIYGGNAQAGRVYADDGISPSIDTCQGGNREPKILIPQNTKEGTIEMEIGGVCDLSYPSSKTRRGRVQEGGTVSPTLTCAVENNLRRIEGCSYGYRIRKLTERECFRLMGLAENEIDTLMSSGISKTRLYQLAGNSIVVDVLVFIFDKFLVHTESDDLQLKLF